MLKQLFIPLLAITIAYAEAKPKSSIRNQLVSALMGNDALGTMRHIAKMKKSQLKAEGIKVEYKDDGGYDEVIKVHLSEPIVISGAKTNLIVMAFDSPYPGFNGLVFAEFEGDLLSFVKANKLSKGQPKNTTNVGTYNRPLSQEHGCPVTLGATRIKPGRFVFGCGWCNG